MRVMTSLTLRLPARLRFLLPSAMHFASQNGKNTWQKSSTLTNNSSKLFMAGLLGFLFGSHRKCTQEVPSLSIIHVNNCTRLIPIMGQALREPPLKLPTILSIAQKRQWKKSMAVGRKIEQIIVEINLDWSNSGCGSAHWPPNAGGGSEYKWILVYSVCRCMIPTA